MPAEKENKEDWKNKLEESEKNKELLITENQLLKDLVNLRDTSYYRQQKLMLMERMATAQERQAKAVEDSLNYSEEEKNETN